MSEPVAGPGAAPIPPVAGAGTAPNEPGAVSAEAFAELRTSVDSLNRSVNALHAAQRKGGDPAAPAPRPTPESQTIVDRVKALEARESRVMRATIRSALGAEMSRVGVPIQAQDLLHDHVVARHGPQLVVTQQGDTDLVVLRDEANVETPLPAVVAKLWAERRALFTPAQVAGSGAYPTGPTDAAAGKTFLDMPQDERLKLQREKPDEYARLAAGAGRAAGLIA